MFVPPDFVVPQELRLPALRLCKLTAALATADYEAVMDSQERLRAHSPTGWPRPGFTLAENLTDLIRHEREFDERAAFAYSVLVPNGERVIGCVYINPSEINPSEVAQADVYMWMRECEHSGGMTSDLRTAVEHWLAQRWPFDQVNYVRREYYQG